MQMFIKLLRDDVVIYVDDMYDILYCYAFTFLLDLFRNYIL
jgi:hypothetical protein